MIKAIQNAIHPRIFTIQITIKHAAACYFKRQFCARWTRRKPVTSVYNPTVRTLPARHSQAILVQIHKANMWWPCHATLYKTKKPNAHAQQAELALRSFHLPCRSLSQ